MTSRCFLQIWLCVGLALLSKMGQATGEITPDPDLPQPLDPSVTLSLIEKSPFTRPLDLSDSLQLTGVAYMEGKPVATLLEKGTKKYYLVSAEPNAQGWRLTEANVSSEIKLTNIKIMVGNELVTIHYSNAQLAPTSKGGTGASHYPTDSEAIRNDENGKPFVRGSVYLSDTERERYNKSFSKEAHDKYRDIIRSNREMMFKASPQERVVFSKKVFDAVESEDIVRQGK